MASALRQRFFGAGTPSDSTPREGSPETAEEVRLAPVSKIIGSDKHQEDQREKRKRHPWRKRRSTIIFFLGGLFGLVATGFFAGKNDLIDFPELTDFSMDSLLDVLPSSVIKDARDLSKGEREAVNYDSFQVGLKLVAQGVRAKHPVVMVPGVISTGLESWGTSNKSRQYFRKRLWGSWSMMRALVLDKEEWKRHVMLDKDTGLDPPDIKLRAAQGFDAADFFITGYWIWSKILENLATIGYDPTNSYTAAYDWRLSYANLEVRDQYFTRLKLQIELAVKSTGEKVVIASHSMGGQVLFYFFHWVASEAGGGGDEWVENYIDSWINISGCMLGALKDIPAVLSGEMKDTAQLNAFAVYGLEKFLSKEERAEIFRAMPGISSMLPIGGNRVWGNTTWAPDDLPGQNTSFGSFLNFRNANSSHTVRNLTIDESIEYLFNTTEKWYVDQVNQAFSRGVALSKKEVDANEKDPRKWINPLETRLPLAPSLKIYCFYGMGKPTERGYFYRAPENQASSGSINITIDTALTQGNIDHGVIMGEGDGTVNLLSTAYMCNRGWQMPRYNPANVKVTVYEMPHEPDRFSPRGGPNTGDHVDILGRQSLNDLILRIAAGKGDEIKDTVFSDINTYADRVDVPFYGEDEEESWKDMVGGSLGRAMEGAEKIGQDINKAMGAETDAVKEEAEKIKEFIVGDGKDEL